MANAAGLRGGGCADFALHSGAAEEQRKLAGTANRAVFILLQALVLIFFVLRIRDGELPLARHQRSLRHKFAGEPVLHHQRKLGLSLALRIVEDYQGRIDVTSAIRQRHDVCGSAPLTKDPDSASATEPEPNLPGKAARK